MIMRATRVAPEKAVFRPVLSRSFNAGLSPEKGMATRKTYWEKLRDPRWQKRRLEVMQRAGFKCETCHDDSTTLNVHHKIYRKGAEPWEYADSELMCICEPCHEAATNSKKSLDEALAILDWWQIPIVAGYAKGLYVGGCWEHENPDSLPPLSFEPEEVEGLAAALGILPTDDEYSLLMFFHRDVPIRTLLKYSVDAVQRRNEKDGGAKN
jgi:5-methylcytosine-specific restriction endonuclease McrA